MRKPPKRAANDLAAISRRNFLGQLSVGAPLLALASSRGAAAELGQQVETLTISEGDLKATFRDNSQSPKILSGVASLFNMRHAPGVNAFDPDGKGASAGLNFEHIICGHKNSSNAFTPRHGKYTLHQLSDGRGAMLVRKRDADPWAMASTLEYVLTKPHSIDVDFRCTPHDSALFGDRRYAILFFANYMNDVKGVAIHFRGIEGPNQPEKWIAASAPKGHADWNSGGTYRYAAASDLEYDKDHNFKLNSWSYDYPRFAKPFYFGRAAHGMVFMLMFNKMYSEQDEIRFSVFKFKIPKHPRPAWDFQYVIHRVQQAREYGFKARLVWKKFESADDCLMEYETWRSK